jgi:hypothetical protein
MAAGFFSLNRVGAHFSGRSWLPDERFSLRLDAGVTRFSGLTGPIRFDNEERKWTPVLIGGFEYHMRKYALTIRLSGGRFLYDDEGLMLELFEIWENIGLVSLLRQLPLVKIWDSSGRCPYFLHVIRVPDAYA